MPGLWEASGAPSDGMGAGAGRAGAGRGDAAAPPRKEASMKNDIKATVEERLADLERRIERVEAALAFRLPVIGYHGVGGYHRQEVGRNHGTFSRAVHNN